jgi:hypothetical protein
MSGFINAQAARSRRLATGQGIAPQGPYGLFRDWQRTQTQSSVTALRARDSKWMSGPAGMKGPPAERHLCAVKDPDPRNARSPECATGLVFFP